ncbi:serine/threonine protein kinase [Calothrix sp. NIES-4071]|nr:serine/threonine protein kinase [Calothrix sp. NIES-4071]BAZ57132.1 serine/threonine protein kinase [Calothrix sp. NIES-4105]
MQPPIPVDTILQNRYRIINILGQGGFGRTYLAEDQRRFNEPCAIKELIPNATGTTSAWEKAQELFQREAEILYQIQHPQIPQFRERFEQDHRLFLVQDYVAGKTYRELLEDRKAIGRTFTEEEVLYIIRSLLPVLEHLHSRGIIHRDISPENIIQRQTDNKPVLIDFGVVKELATKLQSPNGTLNATSVGKLGYAPGEQMQTGRAYPNSDLYALAVTAIVLLTGKEPAELYDENLTLWNWQRFAKVNPRFSQVLNRMLHYIPGERYQSARLVEQALDSINGLTQPDVNNNLSNVQTIAVGRRPDPVQPISQPISQPNLNPNPNLNVGGRASNRPDPVIPSVNSNTVLDNPLAVGAIGAAVVVLAGFGSWALVSSIRNQPNKPQETVETSPQSFPSPVITAATTATPTPTLTNNEPAVFSKRLRFDASGVAVAQGKLAANQTVLYTFQGEETQLLTASLAQQGEILLTVLAPNGEAVDGIARNVASYRGTLPFTGRYTIQLTPAPGITESEYNLTVGLEKSVVPTPTQSPVIPTPTPTLTEPTPIPSPSVTDVFPAPTPTIESTKPVGNIFDQKTPGSFPYPTPDTTQPENIAPTQSPGSNNR